ncbi:MAG: FAD-dependent oxidoreductase [Alistipes sp.]
MFLVYTSPEACCPARRVRPPLFNGTITASARATVRARDKLRTLPKKSNTSSSRTRTNEYYQRFLLLSMQLSALHKIRGFEDLHIFRPGYAIEYDYFHRCNCIIRSKPRRSRGFTRRAGQWHHGLRGGGGTGLMAGINASLN